MAGYSRDFLISAFMSRYIKCTLISIESLVHLEQMANDLYDRVGRDSFRTYASLDADAIRVYKNSVDRSCLTLYN
jgi:hypothetical protein